MASWSRPLIFKAAFLLCILLLLFIQFSNFRTNDSSRTLSTISIESQWLQAKVDINGNVTTQNESQSIVSSDHPHNGTDHTQGPNLRPSNISKYEENEIIGINLTIQLNQSANASALTSKIDLPSCPLIPSNLKGPIDVDIEYESIVSVEKKFRDILQLGGYYKPNDCIPKNRVAIVIPYRDRAHHLPVFLKNIHSLLIKQQSDYGIFVVEQIQGDLFNRAALMNVGFLEALKLSKWDCFIFHDVDLIPLDDRNLYRCPIQPRHMSVAIDTMDFKLPYNGIFGGVSAMSVKQFKAVNGFSNSFWGWGGEDDDEYNRLKHAGYHIARYPINIARYKMLQHRKEKANPKRYDELQSGAKKFNSEGLNSIKYKIHTLERKVLYTWILTEIKHDSA